MGALARALRGVSCAYSPFPAMFDRRCRTSKTAPPPFPAQRRRALETGNSHTQSSSFVLFLPALWTRSRLLAAGITQPCLGPCRYAQDLISPRIPMISVCFRYIKRTGPMKLLLVEDDPMVGRLLETALGEAGYSV